MRTITGLMLAFWFVAAPCRAVLQPQEIALVVAEGSRDSQRLAEYYCKVRGVPVENICAVAMPAGETCPRDEWQQAIRPAIRSWLAEHDPDRKLKCLATVWDVPLRIGAAEPDERLQAYREFLTGEYQVRLESLRRAERTFRDWSDATKLVAAPESTSDESTDLAALEKSLEKALQAAQAENKQIPDPARQRERQMEVQQLAGAIGGANILLQALNNQLTAAPDSAEPLKVEFHALRGRNIGLAEIQGLLEQQAPGIDRDAIRLAVLDRAAGWLGSAKWLQEQLAAVAKNETMASFDSELSLVLWPEEYQLLRWQPNYLRNTYDGSQLRRVHPTLMVARIDAPTLALAKGLIDTAVEVEKKGLAGKAYFDARGIGTREQENVAPGSYADYDRALLATADGVREKFGLEVKLDEQPALFQGGDCPEAAIYCGWYSLAKYVDAFEWVPGAVAYHLASSEAKTLRNPDSEVWCKRMLEEGVCATLGPVYEPYLMAFPRPNEFFALLLQGEHTLVECYYLTNPYNSWMMTLIGDPLYRPFIPRGRRPR
ncbi:MAG: TIGR03790 family protein [Pirellulales bacterium]|nr:TIGR03790 family protein [Pirellulales bacterium]